MILSKKESRMPPGNEIITELKYYEIETIDLSAVSCNKIFDYWCKCCYYKKIENVQIGGMSEWFKEAVLKTVVPRGTVGSNPTPSATVQP